MTNSKNAGQKNIEKAVLGGSCEYGTCSCGGGRSHFCRLDVVRQLDASLWVARSLKAQRCTI